MGATLEIFGSLDMFDGLPFRRCHFLMILSYLALSQSQSSEMIQTAGITDLKGEECLGRTYGNKITCVCFT